jgi:hypothetical protein
MYTLLVGRKWVTREEFWTLPPGELWWIVDAMMPAPSDMGISNEYLLDLIDRENAKGR